MITSTNEFRAPWNDQFYRIYFHFELDQDEIGFVSEQLETEITLSGPKDYEKDYIIDCALEVIKKEYENLDYDTIIIDNIE